MQDLSARATLAGSVAQLGAAATTTIPRAEIEAAVAADEPWDLVLKVTRRPVGGGEELHSIAVEFEIAELERLLEGSGEEAVTLAFDAEALEQAVADGDVEAHGLRQTVAILVTVAAGATAGAAAAQPTELASFGPSGEAAATDVVRPDDRATPRPTPVSVADTAVRPDDRAGPRVVPTSAPAPETAVRPDDRAGPRVVPTTAPAPETAVRPDDRAGPRVVPTTAPAPDTAVRPDDRATPRPVPVSPAPVESPGSGIDVPALPGQFVLLAGGVALAIAAAAFASRQRRRVQLT